MDLLKGPSAIVSTVLQRTGLPSIRLIPHRVGEWLPQDHSIVERWLDGKIQHVTQNPEPFHPVIKEFQELIENNGEIYMLFRTMFEQVPNKPPYDKDPTGAPQVRDYKVMLALFNHILSCAPEFNESALVGFPINAILDWPMGTPSGFTAFLHPAVNAQFRKLLKVWTAFLVSSDSRYVLTNSPSGWFGEYASQAMPNFAQTFICDPSAKYHGFASWDDFFTRQFLPGVRPVAFPDNDSIIVNACESAPFKLAHGVQERDLFWIKAQPYSLVHMLEDTEMAKRFSNGTIYQAFLSALTYHRWHSPINGTVRKTRVIDGTYYSEARVMRFDPSAPNDSQGYITEVATRALIYIQADNPAIGLMCFMAVGMAEVSTCDIQVREGQRVAKGEELGMFHFGGSTHCLIFGPQVKINFDLQGQTPGLDATNLPINSAIAYVESPNA